MSDAGQEPENRPSRCAERRNEAGTPRDLIADGLIESLWLDVIPPPLRDDAIAAIEVGDVIGFLAKADNERCLELVFRNAAPLRTSGVYERALLEAFVAPRTNHQRWSIEDLRLMFELADRGRLRAAGDPLPGPGPFTLYRGVAGRGRARRVRGFSWSASVERASFFAHRFASLVPDRFPDPAVFKVTVHAEHVLAYTNSRHEEEFIVSLPPTATPVRVDSSVPSPADVRPAIS